MSSTTTGNYLICVVVYIFIHFWFVSSPRCCQPCGCLAVTHLYKQSTRGCFWVRNWLSEETEITLSVNFQPLVGNDVVCGKEMSLDRNTIVAFRHLAISMSSTLSPTSSGLWIWRHANCRTNFLHEHKGKVTVASTVWFFKWGSVYSQ